MGLTRVGPRVRMKSICSALRLELEVGRCGGEGEAGVLEYVDGAGAGFGVHVAADDLERGSREAVEDLLGMAFAVGYRLLADFKISRTTSSTIGLVLIARSICSTVLSRMRVEAAVVIAAVESDEPVRWRSFR